MNLEATYQHCRDAASLWLYHDTESREAEAYGDICETLRHKEMAVVYEEAYNNWRHLIELDKQSRIEAYYAQNT